VLTVGNHADAAYLIMQLEQSDPDRATSLRKRLAGTGGNRSGCNIASVDPLGHVHYDQFSWHYNCGNIREQPFSEIWSTADDARLSILRDRKAHLPDRCQQCRFLDICNGNLRTRAESAYGDWLSLDPSCYLTPEETISRQTSGNGAAGPPADRGYQIRSISSSAGRIALPVLENTRDIETGNLR
jgi:radical SAM protein with 4Fe4S-binding SPASM domain